MLLYTSQISSESISHLFPVKPKQAIYWPFNPYCFFILAPVLAQVGAWRLHHLRQPGRGSRGQPPDSVPKVQGWTKGHAPGHNRWKEEATEITA